MAMSVQAIGGVWDNCFWMLVIFPGSLSLVVDLCWFWYWHGVEMVTIHHLIQWSTVSRNQCIFDDIQEMGTWFEISLVRSFEMSKNDSRTSGIRAVLAGFIAVREMSGRNRISQGQGIVREFYRVSGKFWHLAKLMKNVMEFQTMSGKMTILDNMILQSPRILTN